VDYVGFAIKNGFPHPVGVGPKQWIERQFVAYWKTHYWRNAKFEMRPAVAADYVEPMIERDARFVQE
jgi:hypothetical protein